MVLGHHYIAKVRICPLLSNNTLRNNVILLKDIKESGLWEGFSETESVSIDTETKVGYKCFRVSRPQLFNSQHLSVALFND